MKAKNMRSILEAADPVPREPGLSDSDAARMRQVIVSVPGVTEPARIWFPTVAVAAVAALLVVGGTIAGLRRPATEPHVAQKAVAIPIDAGERRQVQFATPGGTRIIWTLDPAFEVGGMVP